MSFMASEYLVSSLQIGQLLSDAVFNYDSSQTPQGLTANSCQRLRIKLFEPNLSSLQGATTEA